MRFITTLMLIGGSVLADISPNVCNGMPAWADFNDLHVAYVIMGESEGESELGQSFVADVIYERMIQKNKDAYEVVTEPHQFAGYRETEPTRHVWKLVLKLKARVDVIADAKFTQFRAYKRSNVPTWAINPIWVGNHIFFQERK